MNALNGVYSYFTPADHHPARTTKAGKDFLKKLDSKLEIIQNWKNEFHAHEFFWL